MAVTNATLEAGVSAISNGTMPGRLKRGKVWMQNPILAFCDMIQIPQGATVITTSRIAEYSNVAAFAENGTISATALPTITTGTPALSPFGIAIAWSSEAELSLVEPDRFKDLTVKMALEDMQDFVTDDSTNGVNGLQASITDITTSSGGQLTWAAVRDGATAIRNAIGQVPLVLVVNEKGYADLEADSAASNWSAYANQAMTDAVAALFNTGGIPDGVGFTGLSGYGVDVFKVNQSGALYANGGDTHGLMLAVLPQTEDLDAVLGAITVFGRGEAVTRPDAEVVAAIGPNDEIGISTYFNSANEEPVTEWFYRMLFDVILSNTNGARNIQYLT